MKNHHTLPSSWIWASPQAGNPLMEDWLGPRRKNPDTHGIYDEDSPSPSLKGTYNHLLQYSGCGTWRVLAGTGYFLSDGKCEMQYFANYFWRECSQPQDSLQLHQYGGAGTRCLALRCSSTWPLSPNDISSFRASPWGLSLNLNATTWDPDINQGIAQLSPWSQERQ